MSTIFGTRLKYLRDKAKINQKDLAVKMNISQSTQSQYESGARKPDHDTVVAYADLFDVSTDYLLGRTDDPKRPYYELTSKDRKEIDELVNDIQERKDVGIMLDGYPIDDDSMELFLDLVRNAAEVTKREAKRKFTPKKYRNE